MTPADDRIVQAAARDALDCAALEAAGFDPVALTAAVLATLEPAIRADEREKVAQRIEDSGMGPGRAVRIAARIAREGH